MKVGERCNVASMKRRGRKERERVKRCKAKEKAKEAKKRALMMGLRGADEEASTKLTLGTVCMMAGFWAAQRERPRTSILRWRGAARSGGEMGCWMHCPPGDSVCGDSRRPRVETAAGMRVVFSFCCAWQVAMKRRGKELEKIGMLLCFGRSTSKGKKRAGRQAGEMG